MRHARNPPLAQVARNQKLKPERRVLALYTRSDRCRSLSLILVCCDWALIGPFHTRFDPLSRHFLELTEIHHRSLEETKAVGKENSVSNLTSEPVESFSLQISPNGSVTTLQFDANYGNKLSICFCHRQDERCMVSRHSIPFRSRHFFASPENLHRF